MKKQAHGARCTVKTEGGRGKVCFGDEINLIMCYIAELWGNLMWPKLSDLIDIKAPAGGDKPRPYEGSGDRLPLICMIKPGLSPVNRSYTDNDLTIQLINHSTIV